MRDFRFGVNFLSPDSADEWVDFCRQVEGQGYDVVHAPDHLGAPAPFPMLAAAAQATERLRLGTYVLNACFWNPALLAREIATVDRLSDGRLEIGLGAGHMKSEFDAAGIAWEPLAARVDRLAATVTELDRVLDAAGEDGEVPRPAQHRRPPLLIGGTGDRLLRLAAEHADILAYGGLFQAPGESPGTFRLITAEHADERVRFARAQLGSRVDEVEASALVQHVEATPDRRAAAEKLVTEHLPYLSVDEALETPFLLFGTVDEMARQLRDRRERYGISYFVVHQPYADALAPVIERLRG